MTNAIITFPRITVVTVVYNGVSAIARTLESSLSQGYPNIERVVIDGGSTDGTQAIVQGYGSRIDTFVSEPDAGVYAAMNKAVALATGEYLLFMNCGDVFAGPAAVGAAMHLSTSGAEQLIIGGWIREESGGRQQRCLPSLSAGLFNHQALVYSRSIHRWHGNYLTVPGWTTADYLFFVTLFDSPKVASTILTEPIARIDVSGISAGLQTFSQKQTIDYLCGRIGRWRLIALLSLHPAYHRLKQLWRGLR